MAALRFASRAEFGRLNPAQPELLAWTDRTACLEDAEAVMYTFTQALEDRFKQGKAEGRARGEARGRAEGEAKGRAEGEARATRRLLLQFVAEAWGDAEAERFARQLEGTEPDRMPNLRDLMADQRAGRSPRLHHNGQTVSAE